MSRTRQTQPIPPVPGLKLPQDIADLVAADQQPREALDDRGDRHMLFWDGKVRSVPIEQWPQVQQELAEKETAAARAAQRKATVRAKAAVHVGKKADQLTLPEMRDILLMFLEERGALADDLTVKDVEEWG